MHYRHHIPAYQNIIDKTVFQQKKKAEEDFSALFCLTLATPAEIAKLQLFSLFLQKLFTTYLQAGIQYRIS